MDDALLQRIQEAVASGDVEAAGALARDSIALGADPLRVLEDGFTAALRGAGDTRVPVLFSLVGFFAVRIPLALYLTRPELGLGLLGAWLAMVTDLALRGVFFLLRGGLQTADQLRRAATILVIAVALGALTILALVRGQIPDNQISHLLAPLLTPFQVFPGVSGDVLEVNNRFPVHHYGLAYLLLIMALFLTALAVLGRDSRRAVRALAGLVGLGLATLLAATEARGAMLALAVAVAVVAGLRSRWFWGLLPLGALSLYLLLARGVINRSIEADWLDTRLWIWSRSLSMLGDYPLTGSGLGMPTFAQVDFGFQHRRVGPIVRTIQDPDPPKLHASPQASNLPTPLASMVRCMDQTRTSPAPAAGSLAACGVATFTGTGVGEAPSASARLISRVW